MSRAPRRYLLRGDFVAERLDAAHVFHLDFAEQIGLSRSYFSQVLNGRRHLSPRVRRALLEHPLFTGVPEADLWTIEGPTLRVVGPGGAA